MDAWINRKIQEESFKPARVALGREPAPSPEYADWIANRREVVRDLLTSESTRPAIIDPDGTVTLYRGAGNAPENGQLAVRELSSWSDNPVIASGYGPHVVKAKIPVEDVWGWHGQSDAIARSNKAPEREWVILSGSGARPVEVLPEDALEAELRARMPRLHRPKR